MAKKILYKRMMDSQKKYWPATFEDISDDEIDEVPAPFVTHCHQYALDFSLKKESPVSYPQPRKNELDCADSLEDRTGKEVPINMKIKREPLELEDAVDSLVDTRAKEVAETKLEPFKMEFDETDLIIDTNYDDDERLLQEWNVDQEQKINNDVLDNKKEDIIAPKEIISAKKPKLEHQYASINCQSQSIEQFNCNFCTRKYWKLSKLKDHLKNHHFGKRSVKSNYDGDKRNLVSQCPDCRKQLHTKTDMYVHRLTHRNPSFAKISCILCKEDQFTYRALQTHMQEKHGIREKWFCPICPDMRTFTQNHSLLIHISTFHFDSTKQAPAQYPCDKCQRTFTSKALLGKHLINGHVSPSYTLKHYKMFKCEYCQDFFHDLVTLKKHSPCFKEKKNSNVFSENNSEENLVFNTQKHFPLNEKFVPSHSPFTISSILSNA